MNELHADENDWIMTDKGRLLTHSVVKSCTVVEFALGKRHE